MAEKKVSDPVPNPVFPPAGGEAQPEPAPVQDYEEIAAAAAAEAERARVTPHEHLPLHGQVPLVLPYVTHVANPVVVSLNQISEHEKEFEDLAKGLAVDASEELKRTVLKPDGGKITGFAAEDHVKAAHIDIPLDQSRAALVDAVLSAPGVALRISEENAAKKIVDTIINAMGDDAALFLSAYLDTAKSRLMSKVSALLTSVKKGGITYSDDVELKALDKARKCAKPHQQDQVETFQKGIAYDGWSKGLYEYATFDSSPEYTAAAAPGGPD